MFVNLMIERYIIQYEEAIEFIDVNDETESEFRRQQEEDIGKNTILRKYLHSMAKHR